MKKKKIKVNLMRGDAVAAQLIVPVNDDPAGEWPKAVESAIDQSGIRNIIDFVTREPEKENPRETGIRLSTDELRKILDLTEEIKRLLDEVTKTAHIEVTKDDELPF